MQLILGALVPSWTALPFKSTRSNSSYLLELSSNATSSIEPPLIIMAWYHSNDLPFFLSALPVSLKSPSFSYCLSLISLAVCNLRTGTTVDRLFPSPQVLIAGCSQRRPSICAYQVGTSCCRGSTRHTNCSPATHELQDTISALYLRCLWLPATENPQINSNEREVPVSWGLGELHRVKENFLEGWANFSRWLSGLLQHACIHPFTHSAAVPWVQLLLVSR